MTADHPTALHSPAAERNAAPILAELQRLLPSQGLMLEIASGTGQHAAAFSAGLPGWDWQPTEADAALLPSIRAWCAGQPRVRPPLRLDVGALPWPAEVPARVDAMFCANMIHIAPWPATRALMQAAGRHLRPGGMLLTYGPYLEDGMPAAPSNLAFDADLRRRDARWGLRRLADVAAEAASASLELAERIALPANNLLLAWRRRTPSVQAVRMQP
jgi:SAM-dependent methyltransferase